MPFGPGLYLVKVQLSEETLQELRKLTTTRRAHRGQMTKLINHGNETVHRIMASVHTSSAPSSDTQALVSQLTSMNSKLEILEEVDTKILDLTPVETFEDSIVDADDYIEELQLPTFDGNILEWNTFHDAFCAAVHSDDNLYEIQKFQYLRANLKGEAARTVDGLPLTNTNYNEALILLRKRYGQPHQLIAAYMKVLWQLPSSSSNITSLRNVYDNMESYIRGLHSLG